mmetsp:Transcript_21495/g.64158  ORF Transcript_21495/g.64158 Transcript_21495/m.64158 type:complete len:380 (-) Transcript_21495:13-1152(-)
MPVDPLAVQVVAEAQDAEVAHLYGQPLDLREAVGRVACEDAVEWVVVRGVVVQVPEPIGPRIHRLSVVARQLKDVRDVPPVLLLLAVAHEPVRVDLRRAPDVPGGLEEVRVAEGGARERPLVPPPEERAVLHQRGREEVADVDLLEHGHELEPLRVAQAALALVVVERESLLHHLLVQEAVASARHRQHRLAVILACSPLEDSVDGEAARDAFDGQQEPLQVQGVAVPPPLPVLPLLGVERGEDGRAGRRVLQRRALRLVERGHEATHLLQGVEPLQAALEGPEVRLGRLLLVVNLLLLSAAPHWQHVLAERRQRAAAAIELHGGSGSRPTGAAAGGPSARLRAHLRGRSAPVRRPGCRKNFAPGGVLQARGLRPGRAN